VKDFARMQLSNPPSGPAGEEYRKKYPCPPYKIIILDEADSMTQDAQSALRRTMETYSKITRFCLICNYVTRIIDPLASRCSKFRFKSLDGGNARKRLENIAAMEKVKLDDGVVDTLIRCAEGDLRKAITFLQSAARLAGAEQSKPDDDAMDVDGQVTAGSVSVRSVEEIAGVVPDRTVSRLVQALQPNTRASVYDAVSRVVQDLVAEGWSATQLVSQLYEQILMDDSIDNPKKNRIVMSFSQTDKRLIDGSDEHLTILDLSLQIAGALAGS
ncbi:P-loop containing nucleoside triphosphate hydrolase protein, partial [Aureobasidium melanogenum]